MPNSKALRNRRSDAFVAVATLLATLLPAATRADGPSTGTNADLFYARRGDPWGNNGASAIRPGLFTGAAELSIPIEVPAAAAGAVPRLSLAYSSRKGRGNAGVGWSIDVPRISRSTRYGHDLARTWTASQAIYESGGEELVRDTTTATDPLGCVATRYYRKSDRNERYLFCEVGNYWTVTSKDGSHSIYGHSTTARLSNIVGSTTFEWHLETRSEPHGARWRALYTTVGGMPRLNEIEYALNASDVAIGFKRRVMLTWETRPDVGTSYRYGEQHVAGERIASVEVQIDSVAGWRRIRRYALTYVASQDGGSSLLSTVREYGTDDTESFPARTFTYQTHAGDRPGFSTTPTATFSGPDPFFDSTETGSFESKTLIDVLDVDGDGYNDHVDAVNAASTQRWRVRKGRGLQGLDPVTEWQTIPLPIRDTGAVEAPGSPGVLWHPTVETMTIDMDGDGLLDVFSSTSATAGVFYRNTGSGFSLTAWSGTVPFPLKSSERSGAVGAGNSVVTKWKSELVDLSGDACPDWVRIVSGQWQMFRNRACDPAPSYSFEAVPTTLTFPGTPPDALSKTTQVVLITDIGPPPQYSFGPMDTQSGFQELNGDGLVDFIGDGGVGGVFFNDGGAGFVAESGTTFSSDVAAIGGPRVTDTHDAGLHGAWIDMNHDARVDVVRSNGPTGSGDNYAVYLNTGKGIQTIATDWPAFRAGAPNVRLGFLSTDSPASFGAYGTTRVVDMSGDGIVDFLRVDVSTGTWTVYAGNAKQPEVLLTIQNGLGGMTNLTWDSTVGGKDGGNLGFALPVLNAIDVFDGLNTVPPGIQSKYTTTISYSGSFFDRAKRAFSGFERVTVLSSDNVGSAVARAEHVFATGEQDRLENVPLGRTSGGAECTEVWRDDAQLAGLQIGVRRGAATGAFESESWTPWDAISEAGVPASVKTPRVLRTRGLTRNTSTLATKLVTSTRTYDTRGNPTAIHEAGESIALSGCTVDPTVAADERSTLLTWAADTARWIFAPSEVRLCADQTCGSGNVLRHRRLFYDFDDFGTYTLGQILDGDLSRESTWVKFGAEPEAWADTTFTVDDFGNVTSVRDPNGDVVDFVFGPSKTYVTSESVVVSRNKQTPLTLTWSATWDEGFGSRLTSTDPNLRRLTSVFDKLGRVTQVKSTPPENPAGADVVIAENAYSLGGATGTSTANWIESKSYSDAATFLKTKTYLDGLGRAVQSKSPGNLATEWITSHVRFTHHGSPDVATLPFFSTEAFTPLVLNEATPPQKIRQTDFDWAGRPTEVEMRTPAGQSFSRSTASYDRWVSTVVDPKNFPKRYTRDAFGRLAQVQEGDGASIVALANYTFDRAGNLVTIQDANGNQTRLEYDSRGLKREVEDPNRSNCGGIPANCPIRFAYDLAGSLASRIDAKAQETRFLWDELGRLYQKDFVTVGEDDVLFTHDVGANALGRMNRETRGAPHDLAVSFDNWGRVTSLTQTTVGSPYVLQKSYDWLGRATSVTYPTAEVAEYAYGLHGAPQQVAFAGANILSDATYDAFLRRTTTAWGNGLSTEATFGIDERLERLDVTDGASSRMRLAYGWDANGNPVTIEDQANLWLRDYSYDWANRLTSGQHSENGVPTNTWSLQYDLTGNITNHSDWAGAPLDGSYQYGTNAGPAAVTRIGGASSTYTLTYDANGALVNESTGGAFGYNFEGRVAGASDSMAPVDPGVKFRYDGGGERRIFKAWTAADRTNHEVHYVGAYYEREIVDGVPFDDRYVLLDGERVALISTRNRDAPIYLHGDHQGSLTLVTDAMGAQVERRTYAPFGNPLTQSGKPMTSRGYTGEEEDREIGQIHLGIREHHFAIARWISPDPIIPNLARPQSLNPYSYVENMPTRFVDPSGYAPGDPGEEIDAGETVIEITEKRLPSADAAYVLDSLIRERESADKDDEENRPIGVAPTGGRRPVVAMIDTSSILELEGDVMRAHVLKETGNEASERLFPEYNESDGHSKKSVRSQNYKRSRWRHCTISCMSANEFGRDRATTFGHLNEIVFEGPFTYMNAIGKENPSDPRAGELLFDLDSNRVGFDLADDGASGLEGCGGACLDVAWPPHERPPR